MYRFRVPLLISAVLFLMSFATSCLLSGPLSGDTPLLMTDGNESTVQFSSGRLDSLQTDDDEDEDNDESNTVVDNLVLCIASVKVGKEVKVDKINQEYEFNKNTIEMGGTPITAKVSSVSIELDDVCGSESSVIFENSDGVQSTDSKMTLKISGNFTEKHAKNGDSLVLDIGKITDKLKDAQDSGDIASAFKTTGSIIRIEGDGPDEDEDEDDDDEDSDEDSGR